MGRLIEQKIPALFYGVSRQPDHFRQPGQVEEADNVMLSVGTGGFTKRFGTFHVGGLGISAGASVGVHAIDRDPTERYILIHNATGSLSVFGIDGTAKTISHMDPGAASYLTAAPDQMAFVTVADYTFILNRTRKVQMASTVSPAQQNWAVILVAAARANFFGINLNGLQTGYSAIAANGTADIALQLYNGLIARPDAADFAFTLDSSFIFIRRNDGANFDISTVDNFGDRGLILSKGTTANSSDLPARALDGMLMKVASQDASYWVKFVKTGTVSYQGYWTEALAPGVQTTFDATTMPYALVRQGDGTFHIKQIDWSVKTVGDNDTVPVPDFVGREINDIVFHRNRLALIADETVFFSQAGDFFNLWPEKSTEVLDSDPFGLTASTNKVSILKWATPFRKSLFVTADAAQFEVSGDLLTPRQAAIDLATSYSVTTNCRPISLGDSLYLPAQSGDDAIILEYLYDDSSLSNTAIEATKHVKGYVSSQIVGMTGDPVTGNLFLRTSGLPGGLYCYTFFWNGEDKAQQAWCRFLFPDAEVRGAVFLADYLYLVVAREGTLYLERLPLTEFGFTRFEYPVHLDRQVHLTGVYNAGTNRTTWTLPYPVNPSVIGVTDNLFSVETRRMVRLNLTADTAYTMSIEGNWSESKVAFGIPFESRVQLSKLYIREEAGAILTGRTQVRYMTVEYQDSGNFEVRVTPDGRDTQTTRLITPTGAESGVFRFPVQSRGDTVQIEIVSTSHFPHTITSAAWTAFFNETSRQG